MIFIGGLLTGIFFFTLAISIALPIIGKQLDRIIELLEKAVK